MTYPATNRSPSIDLLRVLVVVLVVFRHSYPAGEEQALIATVSVPFFFFLTGWLWRPGRRTLAGEVASRWRSLGIPYVAWFTVLYAVWAPWYVLTQRLSFGALAGPVLGGEWAQRPFTTFWFISTLFFVAVGMRVLDGLPTVMLAVVSVGCLLLGGVFGNVLALVPLGAGIAVPALGFALAARLLRAIPRDSGWAVAVAASLIPVLVVASWPLGFIDMKYGILGTPVLSGLVAIALAWSSIVVLDWLFEKVNLSRRVTSWISSMTSVALVPVLLHPVVLWVFDAPPIGAPWWVFVLAVVLPWTAALLIQRSPLSRWFVGAR
ncbi:acyltransferase family protein [Pseudoclavibacter helvolus]|uniref:Acyltransferase 3 domain-containing protein n=1 Tax=Pseudoclavibacter helvolus TaxID=255205 RepID=A0A7W4YF97_9MICO|nr:hypothetical protein [Pseudoclavibacter helvolus]